MQLDLFDITPQTAYPLLQSRLHEAAKEGSVFYSVGSVAKLFNISKFRVHYLITHYRLDAILIGGEYKIPYTSILDYLLNHDQIKAQYIAYLNYIELLQSYPKDTFKEVNKTRIRYDDLPAVEESLQDWYCLDDLNLPYEATIGEWAKILLTDSSCLATLCKQKINGFATVLQWPDVYDFLIEREVVNLPIPYKFKEEIPQKKEESQLTLF